MDIVDAEIAPREPNPPVYSPPETDPDDGTVTWDLARNCVIGANDEENGDITMFATVSSGRNVTSTATPDQIIDFAARLIQFARNRAGAAATDHAATALDQLKLADDLAETREQLHACALAAAQVHANLSVAEAIRRAGATDQRFTAQRP